MVTSREQCTAQRLPKLAVVSSMCALTIVCIAFVAHPKTVAQLPSHLTQSQSSPRVGLAEQDEAVLPPRPCSEQRCYRGCREGTGQAAATWHCQNSHVKAGAPKWVPFCRDIERKPEAAHINGSSRHPYIPRNETVMRKSLRSFLDLSTDW